MRRSLVAGCLAFSWGALQAAPLEEVIVTAQKRAESVQEVPISIQAFAGETLELSGVGSTTGLDLVTPGLQMKRSGAGTTIFMRGMGNQDATGGQEGSVGTYVDGIWFGSVTGSITSLANVERVEVLKGPQGTLFGRNTTGGVINIVTRDPSPEAEGRLALAYGNYDRRRASFYGTAGVTENIAADLVAAWSDQGEGYGENLVTGNDISRREDHRFLRTKWQWSGEDTQATLSYMYERFDDDTGWARVVPKGFRDASGQGAPSNLHDNRTNIDPLGEYENWALGLYVTHEMGPVELVSITGYKDDLHDSVADNDYSSVDIMDASVDFYNRAFTQELRLLSTEGERLNWIVGLFFLDSKAGTDITITGPALQFAPDGSFTGVNDLRFYGDIYTKSYAAFGELEFDLTDSQSITVGLRYTRDEREIGGANQPFIYTTAPLPKFGGIPTPEIPTPKGEEEFSEPTWRLVYNVELSPSLMVYASYNRGFRSGNFNAVSPAEPAFEPEFIDAYEVGFKSDWLGSRVYLNGAVFYYEVEDLQFQTLEGFTARTINAATATIQGAEFDLRWQATEQLTLSLAASWIDGEYDDFPNAVSYPPAPGGGSIGIVAVDASGNALAKTPEFEASLGMIYTQPTAVGMFTAGLAAKYNDGHPWEADNRLKQESYTLVNLTLGWDSPDQRWGLRLIGENLLDEEYSLNTATSAPGYFYAAAPPRTWEVEARYNF